MSLKILHRFSSEHTRFEARAGLKPMQPMQLHWAPRLWGPRAMLFG